MNINDKTIEKLRKLINEETKYRSGPKLVEFFNSLGFNDTYGQGFPSRWMYTEDRLKAINGTSKIKECIKKLFAPQNFIGQYKFLDELILDLNQYLAYDDWKVTRKGKEIFLTKAEEIDFSYSEEEMESDNFLEREFNDISIKELGLDYSISSVLDLRLEEIKKCLSSGSPLAVIFLSGSTLEGILLGFALKYPKKFNQSKCSPKSNGKVKSFPKWTLSNLIDVAYDIEIIQEDVKKYSHSLRDFRNYIHPYMQMNSQFNPSEHTAKISFQVLKAAIYELIATNNK